MTDLQVWLDDDPRARTVQISRIEGYWAATAFDLNSASEELVRCVARTREDVLSLLESELERKK
ncbi:MAG: hypothetical protein HC882_02435 [Acidobacteria bacterium]|nr:hypothetical protein [Acidobacteriota bacterium]